MKKITVLALVTLVAACSGTAQEERGYVDSGQVRGERVRIPPCNPFHADDLMDWAGELDGRAYHDRDARASVDAQGWVRCSAHENAGSSYRR